MKGADAVASCRSRLAGHRGVVLGCSSLLGALALLLAGCKDRAPVAPPAPTATVAAGARAGDAPGGDCPRGEQGCQCKAPFDCNGALICIQHECWNREQLPKDVYFYTKQSRRDVPLVHDRINRAMEVRPGERCADIGAGVGLLTAELAKKVGPKGEVIATDIAPSALRDIERMGLPNVRTRLTKSDRDTALTDLPRGSLSVILLVNSVIFGSTGGASNEADLRYLRELRERMTPAGELFYHVDWLATGMLGRDAVIALFRKAGFAAKHREIPMPEHIPAETKDLRPSRPDAGPPVVRAVLRRGFILAFRAS